MQKVALLGWTSLVGRFHANKQCFHGDGNHWFDCYWLRDQTSWGNVCFGLAVYLWESKNLRMLVWKNFKLKKQHLFSALTMLMALSITIDTINIWNNGFPLRLYPIYRIVYLFDKCVSHIYISDTSLYVCTYAQTMLYCLLLLKIENKNKNYWQKFYNSHSPVNDCTLTKFHRIFFRCVSHNLLTSSLFKESFC